MTLRSRFLVVLLGAAALTALTVSQGLACWGGGCSSGYTAGFTPSYTTSYMPVTTANFAPTCSTCSSCNTCGFTPATTTSFMPVYTANYTPVYTTSYRPLFSSYRVPLLGRPYYTSYYTSYYGFAPSVSTSYMPLSAPVATSCAMPCSSCASPCSSCSTGCSSCSVGAVTGGSGCSSCAAAANPGTTIQPIPATQTDPANVAPNLNQGASVPSKSNYATQPALNSATSVYPAAANYSVTNDSVTAAANSAAAQDRLTQRPAVDAVLISHRERQMAPPIVLDNSGWEAVKD